MAFGGPQFYGVFRDTPLVPFPLTPLNKTRSGKDRSITTALRLDYPSLANGFATNEQVQECHKFGLVDLHYEPMIV